MGLTYVITFYSWRNVFLLSSGGIAKINLPAMKKRKKLAFANLHILWYQKCDNIAVQKTGYDYHHFIWLVGIF